MHWMDFERPHTMSEWFLTAVADLDFEFHPGVLAKLLRSSPHRRHVAAAIIAIRFPDRRNGYPPEAAEAALEIASGRLVTLLQKWLPTCPAGLLGALSRMDDAVEVPDFYRRLFVAYSDPEHRDVIRALRHVRGLNSRMLAVVMDASPILLRSGGWQLAKSPRQLGDLTAAISLIEEFTDVNDLEIARSLSAALAHGSVTKFIKNWLGRSRLPTSPDIGHPMIRPISTAADLHRTALEFENCMAGYLLDILSGKEAFYVADSPVHGRMVARIAQEEVDAPWLLLGVHLKRNRTPTFAASEWVAQQFAGAGIRPQHLRRRRGKKWAVIERLLDPVLYDFDDMSEDWEP